MLHLYFLFSGEFNEKCESTILSDKNFVVSCLNIWFEANSLDLAAKLAAIGRSRDRIDSEQESLSSSDHKDGDNVMFEIHDDAIASKYECMFENESTRTVDVVLSAVKFILIGERDEQ